MKKFLILLGMLLISNNAVMAGCTYSCVTPYDMNNKFMSVMSNISGMNFLGEKVTESVMKREFSKIVKEGKIKYDLKSYSARDLKNGIFKSMSIKGENLNINGIYLSSLEMKTLCDFNYIKPNDNSVTFMEDLPISISLKMNASDIDKTMQSEKYKKVINDVNRLGLGGIKISSTNVEIKNNKFYYNINVAVPFIKYEKKITIGADLKAVDGSIDFENTKLSTGGVKLNLSKIDYIINYLNPLDFSVKILDNVHAKVSVKNVNITDDIVNIDAIAVITKN